MLGLIGKENAAAKAVRQGVISVGINDDGTWEVKRDFFRSRIRRSRVLQGEVQVIGDHAQDHLPVIPHLAF